MSDAGGVPPPPPGFVLDKPKGAGAVPPPPPGFVLDQAPQQQAAPPQPGLGQRILDFVSPTSDKMLNLEALTGVPSALSQSAQIQQETAYKPGDRIFPEHIQMRDPMMNIVGPSNLGAIGPVGGLPRPMPPRNPTATQRLQDFQGAGVTASAPAVGQGMATGAAAQAGRVLPFSPVGQRIQGNISEAQARAEGLAGQLGSASAEQGPSIARNALKGFEEDKSQAAADYGEVRRLMHGLPPQPVTPILAVLNRIRARFPNAPELTGLFTNPKLKTLQDALTPRKVTTPPTTSPMLDPYGRPIMTSPGSTVTKGGTLSIPELQELKTQVRYMLDNPVQGDSSIPRGQLKQLYGAVKQTLLDAAKTRPAAYRALVKAEANYSLRANVLDTLSGLLRKDSPDSVWAALNDAAGSGRRGDVGLLRTAKRAMDPADWGDVGASVVRRLGAMSPGLPRPSGTPEFSVGTFATNWRRLSPKAKDAIFGPNVPGSTRAGLEELGRVTGDLQNVGRLANTSNSYNLLAAAGAIQSIFTAIMTGHAALGLEGAAGMGGAYALTKFLMSPTGAKMLNGIPKVIQPGSSMAQMQDALTAAARSEAGKGQHPAHPAPPKPPPQRDPRSSAIGP